MTGALPTPGGDEVWRTLRRLTQARIGLSRSGITLATDEVLRFQADHAAARDAVHTPPATADLCEGLAALGLGDPVSVTSRASSRAEYLRRPDLGRLPADLSGVPNTGADVGLVIADGLSATAVDTHAVPLVEAVAGRLVPEYVLAPPVVATQARVALGDHIGQALGVDVVLVIIGERPGLSVADSLGLYLTYRPVPGRRDSERNCVSNVHPPDGLEYADAARIVHDLIAGARRLGASGVALKAESGPEEVLDPSQRRTIPGTVS